MYNTLQCRVVVILGAFIKFFAHIFFFRQHLPRQSRLDFRHSILPKPNSTTKQLISVEKGNIKKKI